MSNLLIEYISNIWYVGDWTPIRYYTYNTHMKDFETRLKHYYPFGKDSFCLDHGDNYFMFFRRIGEPFYYALFDTTDINNDDIVIGTICYVYRKLRDEYIMYICDLKFDPIIRNKGIMNKIIYRTIPNCLLRTTKFYAISMNDNTDDTNIKNKNKILKMCRHIASKYNIQINSTKLNIYSLDYDQMLFIHNLVTFIK